MNEKELFEFWKKYVDIPIYRVIPSCDIKDIKKGGINPKKDPYTKIKNDFKIIRRLVFKLESQENLHYLKLGNKHYLASVVSDMVLADFNREVVDFCARDEEVKYYLTLKGGAATSDMKNIIDWVARKRFTLTPLESRAIKNLKSFISKRYCDNIVTSVNGTSKVFERALFKKKKKSRSCKIKKYKPTIHLESPFGGFEHFKKVIKKNSLREYSYCLRTKQYYLRVRDKIPKEEINFVNS